MELDRLPTGIFCESDVIAIGVLKFLQKRKKDFMCLPLYPVMELRRDNIQRRCLLLCKSQETAWVNLLSICCLTD